MPTDMQTMHDSREYVHECHCQHCSSFFRPDAEDMDRWKAGFAPVRCAACKEEQKKKNG